MTDQQRQFEDMDEMAEFAVTHAALLSSLDRKAEAPLIAVSESRSGSYVVTSPEAL